jgi:hypothetical protein
VLRLEGSGVCNGSMGWSTLGGGGCVLVGWVGSGAGAGVLVACLVGVWVEKTDILEVGAVEVGRSGSAGLLNETVTSFFFLEALNFSLFALGWV